MPGSVLHPFQSIRLPQRQRLAQFVQCLKDIMLTVQAPKYAPKEVEIFTKEEITIILSSIKESKYYSKYYPIFLFAITTGARLGEILGLKINSVHKGYVQIENNLQDVQGVRYDETPKTRAGYRRVTISAELEKMLRHYPIGKVVEFNRYVFQTRLGTPMAPRNLERIWRNVLNVGTKDVRNLLVPSFLTKIKTV